MLNILLVILALGVGFLGGIICASVCLSNTGDDNEDVDDEVIVNVNINKR